VGPAGCSPSLAPRPRTSCAKRRIGAGRQWRLPHWDDRRCPFDRAALGPTEVLQGLCTVAKGCRDQCVLRDAVFKALLPDLYAHWLHAPRAQGTKRGFGSHVLTKVSVHEEALWGLCEAGVLAAGSVPVWVTREGAGERARGHKPPRAFSERDVALVAGAGARGLFVCSGRSSGSGSDAGAGAEAGYRCGGDGRTPAQQPPSRDRCHTGHTLKRGRAVEGEWAPGTEPQVEDCVSGDHASASGACGKPWEVRARQRVALGL
jgi:hypothetical protein